MIKPKTITELISDLQGMLERYGDLPVYLDVEDDYDGVGELRHREAGDPYPHRSWDGKPEWANAPERIEIRSMWD